MRLNGVLFLAAFTTRSRAYAEAMVRAELVPEHVLLFGAAEGKSTVVSLSVDATESAGDLFIPRCDTPLPQICRAAGWNMSHCPATSANGPEIAARLRELNPEIVIYSGYGGQIVGEDLLNLGPRFLHFHAGWLPDFRGSTTIYYSWLIENNCGVSALFLDRTIDTGPVVARRRYPPPPPGIDVDRIYDSAIRADLLVDVLKTYATAGDIPVVDQAEKTTVDPFYVIHPLLKHIALLRRETHTSLAAR